MKTAKHYATLCAAAALSIPACMSASEPDDAIHDAVAEAEQALSSEGSVCITRPASQDAVIRADAAAFNDGATEQLSTGISSSSGRRRTLLQFDLSSVPAGATVVNSTMGIYQVYRDGAAATVNVHQVTAAWAENSVTWNSLGSSFDPAASASFTASSAIDYRRFAVDELVQGWVDGTPNHGVLLDEPGSTHTNYRSRENVKVDQRPYLEVCYVTCGDGIQNGDETGVDCGGSCATACASCNDGIQNGSETGVDCGGSCAPCATCNDGIRNGSETGVDCGGSCAPCATCNDGIKNGGETGVDCGGPICGACATCNDGIHNGNETGIDCGGSCAPCATCNDGIRNGGETGVDCGGPICGACATCNDGIRNGNETGVDCGGSCGPCAPTSVCGNGVREPGEECDGRDMGDGVCGVLHILPLCNAQCKYTFPWLCHTL
ncbi:DNRLRE domain-containing protein [Chondromyces crocatus]|uniref:Carbohydrate-binding module family 96 domain-containing protein n=1 Tax=Chondromyces crocatus TaxID=52 RepID=A0A0K1ERV9_CHOCO|nr:DNRLRE domain-containing protein [Chondromyces crocatus]AKT43655.1 uncharacterized protein CMC5_078900 [Chondromyces crocatus]